MKNKKSLEVMVLLEDWFIKAAEQLKVENNNPLMVLSQIMSDPMIMPATRVKAAECLAKYIVPVLPKQIDLNIKNFTDELTNEQIYLKLEENRRALAELDTIDGVYVEQKRDT